MESMASQITSLSRLFGRRSKKISKLRVTGLCAGNSPGTGEFPAKMASNAEKVSIWWRHHDTGVHCFLSMSNISTSYTGSSKSQRENKLVAPAMRSSRALLIFIISYLLERPTKGLRRWLDLFTPFMFNVFDSQAEACDIPWNIW